MMMMMMMMLLRRADENFWGFTEWAEKEEEAPSFASEDWQKEQKKKKKKLLPCHQRPMCFFLWEEYQRVCHSICPTRIATTTTTAAATEQVQPWFLAWNLSILVQHISNPIFLNKNCKQEDQAPSWWCCCLTWAEIAEIWLVVVCDGWRQLKNIQVHTFTVNRDQKHFKVWLFGCFFLVVVSRKPLRRRRRILSECVGTRCIRVWNKIWISWNCHGFCESCQLYAATQGGQSLEWFWQRAMWWVGCFWLALKFGGVVLRNCNCICSRTWRWNLHIDLKVLFLSFDSSLPHQRPQSRNLHSKLVFLFLQRAQKMQLQGLWDKSNMPHTFDSWACIFQPIYWPPASSSSQVFFSILHCFHRGCSFDKLLSHSWVEVICSTIRSKPLEISKVLLSQDLFKLFCFSTFATSWGKLFVSQLGLHVLSLLTFCLPHLHHFEPQFAPKLLSKPLCISARIRSFLLSTDLRGPVCLLQLTWLFHCADVQFSLHFIKGLIPSPRSLTVEFLQTSVYMLQCQILLLFFVYLQEVPYTQPYNFVG